MVTIRLSRGGVKNRPFYKIVVTDNRYARDGKFLEKIGFFNPIARGKAKKFNINFERLGYWRKQGVIISNRVNSIIKNEKINII